MYYYFLGPLVIFLLIAANAFFVAAEFALVSVRLSRLEELIKENKPLALVTKKAVVQLNDMLSTCQLGITISSLLLGWLGERFIADLIELFQKTMNYGVATETSHGIAITISFILITFLHIILGELVPKTIAVRSSEKTAILLSLPLLIVHYAFYPFTYLFNVITDFILKFFNMGAEVDIHRHTHSPEELKILIQEQTKQEGSNNEEIQILQKSVDFYEHQAKDVMTHRTKIVCIAKDLLIEDFKETVTENNFSRYPVYESAKDKDKIVGVVHVQSLIKWLANPKRNKKETVTAIMNDDPIFIPETLSIELVLKKLREKKQHISIVVDEYGGVSGILTLEDIIEEIFGEIQDETDQEEEVDITEESSNRYKIDGETELEDLIEKEILNEDDIEEKELEKIRTISGLIIDRLKEMPKKDSYVEIKGGKLKVEEMDGNKIVSVVYEKNSTGN